MNPNDSAFDIAPSDEGTRIGPRPLTDKILLSNNQERKARLVEETAGENLVYTIRPGRLLEVATLEKAFIEVGRRHEILRTSYDKKEGQFISVINSEPALFFRQEDLKRLADIERYERMRILYAEEAQGPLTLSQLPNLRISVLNLDDEDIVIFSIHHIAFDLLSFEVLTSDLDAIYAAFSNGVKSPLPKLSVQYADYAYWQRSYLNNEALHSQLFYWKDRLKETPPVLDLPTDRPRPSIPSRMRGVQSTFVRQDAGVGECAGLAKSERTTLSLVLLAVFMGMLHAWTGEELVVVRMPVSGRRRPEVKRLIGFFANLVPIRTRVSRNQEFRNFVRSVRTAVLEAYRNQDIPFGTLLDELAPTPDTSFPMLSQVQFSFEPVLRRAPGRSPFSTDNHELATKDPSELRGGTDSGSRRVYKARTYGLDLSLRLSQWKEGMEATLTYDMDLFEHSTATYLLDSLRKVLKKIIIEPDLPVSKFLE